ncbi:D-2-hydroxyacid dehydrogenase family protein [Acuticoccus sediminis]|uniref:D-2-hydroxyacid dehydrogenase family protein n=1 Tax=Acuticoccus sediminis TaxID=2184697 RepID=UPI001CFEF01A|nr:D-2-hydroxyacid dehydrogenase family protein [Acuticoccus sediminis]
MKIAVLDDWLGTAKDLAPWGTLEAEVSFVREHVAEERLAELLAPFDAVCLTRERTPLTRRTIEALPNLSLIVTAGRRNAKIDIAAATERGITVCGTDSHGGGTVELTWALILGLTQRVPQNDAAMKAGGWQTGMGTLLEGKRLGIVGLGRLGRRVAAIAPAFGMDVVAWSQNLTGDAAAEHGARRVSKEELFATADVVSLHLTLSERTRGIVDRAAIAAMKPTAYFVNAARAGLVDTAALAEALGAGRIAGAAIDVYDVEPLPADDPLRRVPNLVLTPHVGYVSAENMGLFFRQMVEDIAAFQSGHPIRVMTADAPALG